MQGTNRSYDTSKEWRRSMKNLETLETWTSQDGEGSVWLELKFGINTGTKSMHGMLEKMDERIKGNWVIVPHSKYSPLRGTGQRVKLLEELVTGYTHWECNPFLPVPVWKYKQRANSNKKKSSFVTLRNAVFFVVLWLTFGLFIQECNL